MPMVYGLVWVLPAINVDGERIVQRYVAVLFWDCMNQKRKHLQKKEQNSREPLQGQFPALLTLIICYDR